MSHEPASTNYFFSNFTVKLLTNNPTQTLLTTNTILYEVTTYFY